MYVTVEKAGFEPRMKRGEMDSEDGDDRKDEVRRMRKIIRITLNKRSSYRRLIPDRNKKYVAEIVRNRLRLMTTLKLTIVSTYGFLAVSTFKQSHREIY